MTFPQFCYYVGIKTKVVDSIEQEKAPDICISSDNSNVFCSLEEL